MLCCSFVGILLILLTILQSFSVVVGVLAFLIVTILLLKFLHGLTFPEEDINIGYAEQWFGKGPSPLTNNDSKDDDESIKPFKIDVPEDVLSDLKSRLERTRFEDPVEDSKFLYGFNPNYLRKVVDYWRKEYDWRQQERMLNQFPQFKTRIEGIDIHFLHVKPELPPHSNLKILPLMIVHGWPGSVVEFYKLIPLLITPRPGRDFVFEVICPSIPGYGFSESPHQIGFNMRAAARIFVTLMGRIGHNKFYLQGGDWGSIITSMIAKCYSSRVLGLHLNMYGANLKFWDAVKYVLISFFPFLVSEAEYKHAFPIWRILKLFYSEGGYFHIQGTKPDTVGCGMADSPAGMAAYLIEKFSYWTNSEYIKLEDGGLTKKFTMDELLTNAMLYWVNNNFTAAARFYKENATAMYAKEYKKLPITVPSAIAVFPNEILMLPKTCMSQIMKNIISYNIMPRGGHFAAFEEPELLANDVWNFVSIVEK